MKMEHKARRTARKRTVAGILLAGAFVTVMWQMPGKQRGVVQGETVPILVAEELSDLEQEAVQQEVEQELKKRAEKEQEKARRQEEKQAHEKSEIYSFLQGPVAWKSKTPWSGKWYEMEFGGRRFGSFGCGFCCMANIYSTLSPYECSPVDIFQRATEVTTYYPCPESGAIGWEDMHTTLESCGVTNTVGNKPDTYEAFREQMKQNVSMIVLVCSADDASFWENTGGHYVNIWDYEEEADDVFLAEPGNPETNRTRIPLRYVYDALKTSSDFQYLVVESYQDNQDTWQHDGIDIKWRKPKQEKSSS